MTTISRGCALLIGVAVLFLVAACDQNRPTAPETTDLDPFASMAAREATSAARTPSLASAAINQVNHATLTCPDLIDFEDVAGGFGTGTNHDGIVTSGSAKFAERFAGQSLTFSGVFDVLSGAPTSPLTLQVGAAGQNINVVDVGTSNVIDGLGPLGFPVGDAIGEGAFATLFDADQFELGFRIEGGFGGGTATLNFFKRDGSLIETIVISNPGGLLGFRRAGSIRDIAGFSIHNTEDGGFGVDDIVHCKVIEVDRLDKFFDPEKGEPGQGPDPIEIGQQTTTLYSFAIEYVKSDPNNPPARLVETVPAEFDVVSTTSDAGTPNVFQTGKGKNQKSSTKITLDLAAGPQSARIDVVITTRPLPNGKRFKPTSCGLVPLNSGPVFVFEVDPETGEIRRDAEGNKIVLLGPSDILDILALEDPDNPDNDGDGLSNEEEARELGTDPCNPDTDGDGAGDGQDADPLNPEVQ